jgi:zinc transport system permease protein
MLLAILTAVTIVLGMRMMGAMLISSLILFPAITAMRLCKSFHGVAVCAAIVSVVCFLAGLVGSYLYNTPTGASVVVANILAFVLFSALEKLRGRRLRRREA